MLKIDVVCALCIILSSGLLFTDATRKRVIAGGWEDVPKDDEQLQKCSEFAVAEIGRRSNSMFATRLETIVSAKRQLVAGVNYNITFKLGTTDCRIASHANGVAQNLESCATTKVEKCDVVVWQRSWLTPPMQLTEMKCKAVRSAARKTSHNVEKRGKITMVGGWSAATADDETIKNAAQFAVTEMEQQRNSLHAIKLMKVFKAKKQVVSGMKYNITMKMGTTDCRKASDANGVAPNLDACEVTKVEICNATIWEQVWMTPQRRLVHFNCEVSKKSPSGKAKVPKTRLKRSVQQPLVGGQTTADVNSESVNDASQFAVEKLNAESNGFYNVKLTQVKAATKQLVAGLLFRVTLDVQLSSCKARGQTLALCADNDLHKEHVECTASVWDQVWRTPRYILNTYECHPDAHRKSDTTLFFQKSNKTPKFAGDDEGNAADSRPKIGASFVDFEQFKLKYSRVYATQEEETNRYNIFQENMKRAQFIQDHDLGTATYGATMFADFTREEFSAYVSSKQWDKRTDTRMPVAEIPSGAPPAAFDWRDKGVVSPVKNQGSCGSCWAFSVTGNVEGQWAIKKNTLISLSEQELVDCDKLDEGCNGGLPSNAYTEIQRLGGLETEADYPYKGDDEKCIFTQDKVKVYINGSVNISSNEGDMAAWLAQNGPMSIGINAMAMQFYFGGISHPWKLFCPDALDHGVLIVGYAVKHGYFGDTPYWIVKNSWGAGWGEKGYYLVYRGDGTCGLNEMVSSAIIN